MPVHPCLVNQRGDNAVHLATRKGFLDILKLLQKAGADLAQTNIVRTPPNDHYWLYWDKHCTYDTRWSLLAKQRPTSYELFDHHWLYKDKHRTYATRLSLLLIQRDKHRTYDTQWLLLTIQRQTSYVRHPMIIIDQTETNIVRTPPNDYYWPYRDKHRMYATQWSLLTLKRQPS